MSRYNKIFKSTLHALTLVLILAVHSLSANPCPGQPGELSAINSGDLSSDRIDTVISYECVVYDELNCFVVTGGITGTADANKVYQVEPDGSLSEISSPDYPQTLTNVVTDLTFVKCRGRCFVFSIEGTGSPSLVMYEVSDTTGELTFSDSVAFTVPDVFAVNAFVCNGLCYVMTGGEPGANIIYRFAPMPGIIEPSAIEYDTMNTIMLITSFECEDECFIATGANDMYGAGNTLYRFNPCGMPPALMPLGPVPFQGPILDLTSYTWNCKCYVAAGTQDGIKNFVLETPMPNMPALVLDGIALEGLLIDSITSFSCGCKCYLIAEGPPMLTVFEVANSQSYIPIELEAIQSLPVEGIIIDLTAYNCCGCYVISVGTQASTNQVYVMHSPVVVANNNCFFTTSGSMPITLDIFTNDCGCIDPNSTRFYADEQLTIPIGSLYGGTFVNAPTPGGGLLSFDQYNSVRYTPPASSSNTITDCFYYTIDDCCGCIDCAKITIFIPGGASCNTELTISDIEDAVCGDANGSISFIAGPASLYNATLELNGVIIDSTNTVSGFGVFADVEPGTYVLTVTDPNTDCAACTLVTVDLYGEPLIDPLPKTSFCNNDAPIMLSATPGTGTWSGSGVTDLGYGLGTFNPSGIGSGFFTLTYSIGYCSAQVEVCVDDCTSLEVSTIPLSAEFCNDEEFCYEVTVTNRTGDTIIYPIIVTGLINPYWNIVSVEDCSGYAYVEYPAGFWTFGDKTFDEGVSNGEWVINTNVPNNGSVCIRICIDSVPAGDFQLNIQADIQ